jgi:RteC protein
MQETWQMPPGIETLYHNMMDRIQETKKNQHPDQLVLLKECIGIIRTAIEQLKTMVSDCPFQNETEEIHFFKHVKPRFYCQLIYFLMIYDIEIDKPMGNREKSKYFKKELGKLKAFFEKNREFYHYFRSGSTHEDARFFVRGKQDFSFSIHPYYFDADPRFTTSQDIKAARILANELLIEYLEKEVGSFTDKPATETSEPILKVNTSISVAHLGCLLRLLHEEKVFYHPNQTEFLNFFAAHFASIRQEHISGTSLRSKYYNIDPSTAQSVKDLLFQLLNRLKKL